MEKYMMLVIVIIGMLVSYIITRNDKDANKSLTKKGFVKLIVLFSAIFIFAVTFVLVS